jgi:hypothetical protein
MHRSAVRSAAPLATALAIAPLLGGCPLLRVEAEVRGACLREAGIAIDGAAAARSGAVRAAVALDDLSAAHELVELTAELAFARAELGVREGWESLAFVDELRVTVRSGDAGSPLPPLEAFACAGTCAAEGARLTVPAAPGQDALAYLASEALVLEIALRGAVPPTHFALDAAVCFDGRVDYTLAP